MNKARKWYALTTIIGAFLGLLRWLSNIDTPIVIILIMLFSGIFIESIYSLINTNKNENQRED